MADSKTIDDKIMWTRAVAEAVQEQTQLPRVLMLAMYDRLVSHYEECKQAKNLGLYMRMHIKPPGVADATSNAIAARLRGK